MKTRYSPKVIALMKIVKARMNMITEARSSLIIRFLTTCCPKKVEIIATIRK